MSQKKAKAEIPADMWLHVATDALARYVAGDGAIEVAEATDTQGSPALLIIIPVAIDDPRLPPSFVALFPESAAPLP